MIHLNEDGKLAINPNHEVHDMINLNEDGELRINPNHAGLTRSDSDRVVTDSLSLMKRVLRLLNSLPKESPFLSLEQFFYQIKDALIFDDMPYVVLPPETVEIATGYGVNTVVVDRYMQKVALDYGILYHAIDSCRSPKIDMCQKKLCIFAKTAVDLKQAVVDMINTLEDHLDQPRTSADEVDDIAQDAVENLPLLPPRYVSLLQENAEYIMRFSHMIEFGDPAEIHQVPAFNFLLEPKYDLDSTVLLLVDQNDMDSLLDDFSWDEAVEKMKAARPNIVMCQLQPDEQHPEEAADALHVMTGEPLGVERVLRIIYSIDAKEVDEFIEYHTMEEYTRLLADLLNLEP